MFDKIFEFEQALAEYTGAPYAERKSVVKGKSLTLVAKQLVAHKKKKTRSRQTPYL